MHIEIWSIGKSNEPIFDPAVKDYTKRIAKFIKIEWQLFKNSNGDTPAIILQKEGNLLLEKLRFDDCLFVLDRAEGKALNSELFSKMIEQHIEKTHFKRIIFLIGGAYGLDKTILVRANMKISLSTLTFPHQLVRILLAEQLYRAFMVMKNIPYHH